MKSSNFEIKDGALVQKGLPGKITQMMKHDISKDNVPNFIEKLPEQVKVRLMNAVAPKHEEVHEMT